jgi:Kdo2-lipid IVA lauroyltransferase/acyltransferase
MWMLRLFRALSYVPLHWMQRMGVVLGWWVWWLSPTYRRNFKKHVHAAGVDWQAARASIAATGQVVAELPWSWFRPHEVLLEPFIQWEGIDIFERAMQAGRGAIFITPHIGCWELGAQAVAERFSPQYGPMVVLYRPARKAWLAPLLSLARSRPGFSGVPINMAGIRTLLRTLKTGGIVGLLPDQVPPLGQGVWAPFFGRSVYTMTLIGKLAQQTGAPVLLSWCERLGPGQGFKVVITHLQAPELAHGSAASPTQTATALNHALETLIRRVPNQYLWGYARDKQPRSLE